MPSLLLPSTPFSSSALEVPPQGGKRPSPSSLLLCHHSLPSPLGAPDVDRVARADLLLEKKGPDGKPLVSRENNGLLWSIFLLCCGHVPQRARALEAAPKRSADEVEVEVVLQPRDGRGGLPTRPPLDGHIDPRRGRSRALPRFGEEIVHFNASGGYLWPDGRLVVLES